LQTLIIAIVLACIAIFFFLIPALFVRNESPSPSFSDLDDSRLIEACFDDCAKAERIIEHEAKHNPGTNVDFIKKLIWITVVAVAVSTAFYLSLL
jgi:hypothetical protein